MTNFTAELLRRLKRGERVSSLKAAHWPNCPSTKTTSRIGTLRSRGHVINQQWKVTKQGKRFMEYWMGKK